MADQQLLGAAEAGDWAAINLALLNGAYINHTTTRTNNTRGGRTALHLAIRNGHWAVNLRLLKVPGIDADAKDELSNTPLLEACRKGNLALIQNLESLGANPHHRNRRGCTALAIACDEGHTEVVEYLLSVIGVDPNVAARNGRSPLFRSCTHNNIDDVTLLLNHGADVHCRAIGHSWRFQHAFVSLPPSWEIRRASVSLLHAAVMHGGHRLVQVLVDHGAPLDEVNNKGETALHILALWDSKRENRLAMTRTLVEAGANLHLVDRWGQTALVHALRHFLNNEHRVVFLLLANGADIHARDREGNTSLHHAVMNRSLTDLQLLLDRGARVDEQNNLGQTALHIAAQRGFMGAIQELTERRDGADIHARDSAGNTPLHHAAKIYSGANLQLLLDRGARVDEQNNLGQTALHITAEHGCRNAIQELTERHDADISIRDNHGKTPFDLISNFRATFAKSN